MRRFLAMLSATVTIAAALVFSPATQTPATALKGSMFDPGLIVSDSVFYDFGTMTPNEIQRFLESRVPVCKAAPDKPPCLRDLVLSTPEITGEVGRCQSMPAKENIRASQLIFDIAVACGINPRAILVTLQKEQGLISSTNPTEYMYRAAMGMSCPDSNLAQCGKVDSGLFLQLYRGVGQLRWYNNPAGSFTYLKVGRTVSRPLHPSSSCGTKSFELKSWATAALYYYTPYVPNQAALNNLYGTGDSCSSYGNRNFWRFYSDWFGSPIGGGFLLKSATSETFLIVDENKYRIPDAATVEALKSLGPLGTISQQYLDSFTEAGSFSRLVKNAAGRLFFVDASQKFPLTDCALATELGLSCDAALQLTSSQLSALPTGAAMTTLVRDAAGAQFLIQGGVRREVLDAESAAANEISLPSVAPAAAEALAGLPLGAPLTRNLVLAKDRGSNSLGLIADGKYFSVAADTAKEVDLAQWFQTSTGSLDAASVAQISSGTEIRSIFGDAAGNHYTLTAEGKRPIADGEQWVVDAPILPEAVITAIPTVGSTLEAPALIKAASTKQVYLVGSAERRPTVTTTDRQAFASVVSNPKVQVLIPSAVNQIKAGAPAIAPGSWVRTSASTNTFYVDGLDRMVRVSAPTVAAAHNLPAVRVISDATFAAYQKKGRLTSAKVSCEGRLLLSVGGTYYPVSVEVASHYPGKATTLSELNCAGLKVATHELGRFIKVGKSSFFRVTDGKRQPIASKSDYLKLKGDGLTAVAAPSSLLALIPIGTPAKVGTSSSTSTSSGTAGGGSGSSGEVKSHTVKSGETLNSIANLYGTTATAIAKANNLSDPNRLSVGQVLTIP